MSLEDGYGDLQQQRRFATESSEDDEEIEELNRRSSLMINEVSKLILPQQTHVSVEDRRISGMKQGQHRDDWTEPASFALLDAWAEKCVQLNRCNLKLEHWMEVAQAVSSKSQAPKTDVQCKNRLDTLKKRYKHESQKVMAGTPSKWPYLKALHRILKMMPKRMVLNSGVDAGQLVMVADLKKRPLQGNNNPKSLKDDNNSSSSCEEEDEEDEEEEEDDDDDDEDDTRSSKRRKSDSYNLLAEAIAKFGEIFERMESAKQQHVVDLERIRMQYTRDVEMQRMQLFMETQDGNAASWMLAPLLFTQHCIL